MVWFMNNLWIIPVVFIGLVLLILALHQLTLRTKETPMGGLNESVLDPDDKGGKKRRKDEAGAAPPGIGAPQGNILQPDYTPPANTAPPPPLQPQHHVDPNIGVPIQTQAIRQHMNAGQVHLHVDGPNPLKAAIPVAEWYVIMRQMRALAPFTFVDTDNKTVAYLRPYIAGGVFEVAIELAPIQAGPRVTEMTAVTNKR